ncbi:MAG TPA: flagellar M-ring protein FliF [Clostridiales bacterium]|nr:flagellar M-ring protein FliF [Clostridiales bacterium]
MPDMISRLIKQIKEFWAGLEKSHKTRIYITSSIVIVAVTIGITTLTKPSYTTVVSGAGKKEIGEMSSILTENKLWNDVGKDGESLIVNSKDNGRAQILLAEKGYPKGGMTFEDAIKMIGITTTENDKKHIWKQQQANEIAKKIMAHDNIEYAEVSLALPEQSVFLTSDKKEYKPTAFIMVKPKNYITQEQVQGIVMLVSKSVERLDPKDITVVDNNLNLLNSYAPDNEITVLTSQEEMRTKKAKELEAKVYSYFSVGQFDNFDTLRVVVNPFLDFDKVKTQSKNITNPSDMDGGAVISSEERTEKTENVSRGDIPGTDTNPGEAGSPTYLLGNDGNSTYSLKEGKQNFGYDEALKEEEKALGYLIPDKSSMAISLWYGRSVIDGNGISDEFIDQIRIAASMATGIPENNISVSKYKLAAQDSAQIQTGDLKEIIVKDYLWLIILGLLIIGLTITVISMKKHNKKDESAAIENDETKSEYMVPEKIEEYLKDINEVKLDEKSKIQKKIDDFAKDKPEAIAQLIRNWLSDTRDS